MSSSKVKKQLKELLKAPDNRICADCPIKGPTWASINIGVFLCLQCAGIHRDIGVHITKVRSAELDTWQQEWVDVMAKWGNSRANKYWEANCPSDYKGRPNELEAQELTLKLKRFIRDKYERKMWIPKDGQASNSTSNVTSSREVGSDSESSSSSESSEDEQDQVTQNRGRFKVSENKTAAGKLKVSINPTAVNNSSSTSQVDLLGFDMPTQAVQQQATSNANAVDGVTAQFSQMQSVNAVPVTQPSSVPVAPQHVQQAPVQPKQATPAALSSQQKIANIMSMYKQNSAQQQQQQQMLGFAPNQPGMMQGARGVPQGMMQNPGMQQGMMQNYGMQQGMVQNTGMQHGMMQNPGLQQSMMPNSGMQQGMVQNYGLQQGMMQNAGLQQGMMQNAGLQQGRMQNAGMQQGMMPNAGIQQGMMQNAGIQQQGRMQNAGMQQQGRMQNAGMQQQGRMQNAGMQGAMFPNTTPQQQYGTTAPNSQIKPNMSHQPSVDLTGNMTQVQGQSQKPKTDDPFSFF